MGLFGTLFHRLRQSPLGAEIRKRLRRGGIARPLAKFALQRAIDRRFPRTFNLEPTSHCNIACIMCPRERPNKKNGFLDWALFTKVIDEAKGYGPRSITLHKDGEPLMHKRIVDMVAYIKQAHAKNNIYMSSNGLILKEEHARGFIRHKLDMLHISIGAFDRETYKAVRGGDLDDLEQRILMLLEMKRAERARLPRVSVQIIKMPETAHEVAAFTKKWRARGVHVAVEELRHWAGGIAVREEEKTRSGGELSSSSLQPPASSLQPPASSLQPARHPCHALWFAPSINWDGLVSFCCFDWDSQGVVGDVRKQTLAEIWQGETLRWHRQKHLHGEFNFPECQACDHYRDYPDIFFDSQKKPPRPGWERDDLPPGQAPRPIQQLPAFARQWSLERSEDASPV